MVANRKTKTNDPKPKTTKPRAKKTKGKKKHKWIGQLLHTSWGNETTINDFCQIIEVSPSAKVVKCQMVVKTTNGLELGPSGNGLAKASNICYGPIFRLWVSKKGFSGTYPSTVGSTEKETSYRKGIFNFSSPTTEYYENKW